MSNTIQIFFAANDNYAKVLDVALISLIKNSSLNNDYDIHILYNDLNDENIAKLSKHQKENVKISFDCVNGILNTVRETLPDNFYFTISAYHRLFIEKLFPNLDKAVYLDCDVIINDDIAKLYNYDLGDNLLGAINEQNCFLNPLFTDYINIVTGIDPHKYFNSGVLVMNLKKIREFKLLDKFINLLTTYNFKSPMVDQDYLNVICRDKVLLLPNGWNKESVESQPLQGELHLKHYALGQKPWQTKDVEYFDLFWDYAKDSEYYGELTAVFNASKDVGEEEKNKMMQGFVDMVLELLQSENTFKKQIIDKEIQFN